LLRCESENTTVVVDPESIVEADLIIVTRPGVKDIIQTIYEKSDKEVRVIAFGPLTSEIQKKGIPKSAIRTINSRQSVSLGFCNLWRVQTSQSVDMTQADTTAGFVIKFVSGETVYIGGNTKLFSRLQDIEETHKPKNVILTMGKDGMTAQEIAFAVTWYLKSSVRLYTIGHDD
jgi:L-ascorbate metabolism protein UlaG (beta-lactamase superfamily)